MEPAATLTPYLARPGRRVLVIDDLADLQGPVTGTVELPIWLFWSRPGLVFDLGDPYMLRWLYQTVLREAAEPSDLTSYLNGDLLHTLWPELYLPRGVRQAWEDRHASLRSSTVTPA